MYAKLYVLIIIICVVLYIVSPKKVFNFLEDKIKINSSLIRSKRILSVENDRDIYSWWKSRVIRIIRLSVLFIAVICAVGLADIYANKSENSNEIVINRPAEDEEDIDVKINATFQDETTEELDVTISKRDYEAKELETFFSDGFNKGFKAALGKNEDYDRIDSSLNLVKHLPDNPLSVEWQIEPDDIFDQSGELIKEIDKEIVGEITLKLKYNDDTRLETKRMIVYPKVLNKSELNSKKLKDEINKLNEDNPSDKVVKIPRNIDGVILSGSDEKDTSFVFIFFIILAPVLLYMKEKQELSYSIKERERKLLEEYAEFVSKLVLYLKAGGTIKGSFLRMVNSEHDEEDPLFIEINAMVNELNSGVSESVSYERLSKRLKLPCYVRLMNLLIQNHSKGSNKLLDMLKAERANALKEQRDYAKKRGEEASTKLLFPMIILLVVSMIIIMVPAIMSFGI